MAIQIYCLGCRSTSPLETFDEKKKEMVPTKKCRKCGTAFTKDNRKYRVDVTLKGQRITRMTDSLTLAREIEPTLKSDLLRQEFDITHHQTRKKPLTLREVWEKYLPWAQEHKKSWRDDAYYYGKHLEPRFANKALESITAFDLEKVKSDLKQAVTDRQTLCRSDY